jgi:hypothetical protein
MLESLKTQSLGAFITVLFGAVSFLVGQWWTDVPKSRVEIIADWIDIPSPRHHSAIEINKMLGLLGSSATLPAGISGTSRFSISKLEFNNPTAITSKEIELYATQTYLAYDPAGSGNFLQIKPDGQLTLGRLLPGANRTLILLSEDKSYRQAPPAITAISDGVKLEVEYTKSTDRTGHSEWLRKAYEKNSFTFVFLGWWCVTTMMLALVILLAIPAYRRAENDQVYRVKAMDKKTRMRMAADAEYIRSTFPEDYSSGLMLEDKSKVPAA